MKIINVDLRGFEGQGSFTLAQMIAEETKCSVDFSGIMVPYQFYPVDQKQFDEVVELCNLFELPITGYTEYYKTQFVS
jgi:hypothetical protein